MIWLNFILITLCSAGNIAAPLCSGSPTVIKEKTALRIKPEDFENDLCNLRFQTEKDAQIFANFSDLSCSEQIHFNFKEAADFKEADKPQMPQCTTAITSINNLLEVTLSLRKQTQGEIEISLEPKFAQNFEIVADADDSPTFAYNRDFNRSDRENDTKKDDGYIDWAVYIVVLVIIVLPIVAVLYCACKSTMPTGNSTSISASRSTNETRLNQSAKTISQQPMNP